MAKLVLGTPDCVVISQRDEQVDPYFDVEVHQSEPVRERTLVDKLLRRQVPRDRWVYTFLGSSQIKRKELS